MKARPTMADSCEESSGRSPLGMRGMVVRFLRLLKAVQLQVPVYIWRAVRAWTVMKRKG